MMSRGDSRRALKRIAMGVLFLVATTTGYAEETGMSPEKQLTFSPKNHDLDNNDNFSSDGRYLCYDTREMYGPSIDNSTSIELLELETGREIVLYRPEHVVLGDAPAPGVGAVSFNPARPEVAFIHGPMPEEVAWRGPYGKPNRCGALVPVDGEITRVGDEWRMLKDGKQSLFWLDCRDIARDRPTRPGAHRGGTHRHEFSRDGRRVGFTYDDFLLPRYDRTIGYMVFHPRAPEPARCWFAVLVRPVPMGESRPGEIEKAYGDSWVDPRGTLRAFIGKVRNDDGVTYEESLFVAEVPDSVDITTADPGDAERYPSPPQGIKIHRVTHEWAGGIVRGAPDGSRIAYLGRDATGKQQVCVVDARGSDQAEDPAMRPVQVSRVEGGVTGDIRWHPSGKAVLFTADGGIAAVSLEGPLPGETVWLTPHGDGEPRHAVVVSPDGRLVVYNRIVPTTDEYGNRVQTWSGKDCKQIFSVAWPGKTAGLPE
ncbi:MAG TPA: DUF3748 domain-containing protein [Candidatus Hydrogenedentes bacterium]|nr:DUF3748 domain-containing protein [Candidatus Hydrogenedentota bacterium]